jgi:hypothetical protein
MQFIRTAVAIVAGAAMIGMAISRAETTTVTNGGNTATITQSGDPSRTQKRIERAPGHTAIYQRNGGNSSMIIQDSGAAAPGMPVDPLMEDPAYPDGVGPDMPPPRDPAAGAAAAPPTAAPLSNVDVYRRVRANAAPQSQKTMDRLMNAMGLPK